MIPFTCSKAVTRGGWGHTPELLPELGAEVLGELLVVLQAGQQEATALVQQDGPGRTQGALLQVRQDQHHLPHLVTEEGQLQGRDGKAEHEWTLGTGL